MGNVIFGTEAGYLVTGEIGSVIEDDRVGNPKVTYYILLERLDNLLPTDLRERYCLNPLVKVVSSHQ